MISLGIGDPDRPTYPHIVEAMQAAVADPGNHSYPSNRGRAEFREALAGFYERRFDVEIDPETEVMPAIGAKECIYNLCFAFLDPGDVALASDPGYPVYTGGPVLAGRRARAAAARARARLRPRPRRDPRRGRSPRARLMFLNYPNNPTGAVVPDGLLRAGRSSSPASTRSSSSTTTPTRRPPTTATSRRASSRRRGPRRSGSRSSRSPRATT